MVTRPTDEEFASLAAKHALHPEGQPSRPERLEPLKSQGVIDEKSLSEHTLKVMQAQDTQCFRGAHGREVYANDRMNTIVMTNENKPDKSTVFHNDEPSRSATNRLEEDYAKRERQQYKVLCEIRTGGSTALEADRAADAVKTAGSGQASAPAPSPKPPEPTKPGASQPPPSAPKEPEPDWKAKWRARNEETRIPDPPPPPLARTESQSKGRSR